MVNKILTTLFLLFLPFLAFADDVASLPIVGKLNLSELSLPVLAIVLGTIDGLNVCSIGALVMVLSIVLIFKKRTLILLMGGLFLFVVALVYGILVMFWYQLFAFIVPYFAYMRIVISLIALFGGIYFFSEFLRLRKSGLACTTSNNRFFQKTAGHLQKTFQSQKRSVFAMAFAVVLFAAMATIVEFPCSAAIPVVFTGILADAGLGFMGYAFYIALYLLLYLLIEIVIFIAAVFTKQIWLGSGRFVAYATLFGSLVLFFLAYYYYFGVTL